MLAKIHNDSRLRPTGIEIIGDRKWGTHICSIFETPEDLLYMLVTFFKAGIENNEYCVYIAEDSIDVTDAFDTLRKAIPTLQSYLDEGSIQIFPYSEWIGLYCDPSSANLLKKWDELLEKAFALGFEGLRINSCHLFSGQSGLGSFTGTGIEIKEHVKDKKILVLCTSPLSDCSASEIIEIIAAHETVYVKRKGSWDMLESIAIGASAGQFNFSEQSYEERLEGRIVEGTRLLNEANIDLENSVKELIVSEGALQNSESYLYSIFNNIKNSIIVLDIKLNILIFNRIANTRAGYDFGRQYVRGANILDIVNDDRKVKMKADCYDALTGKEVVYESSYPAEDNSICWYLVRIFPVINDNGITTGLCISAEDITQRKMAEAERESITIDLLHRNKDLEQFSYMVSHNLRAPVANIIGFANICNDVKCPEETRRSFIEQIYLSSRKLDEEIRDLNDILKVRSGPGELNEEIQFSAIVKNVTEKIAGIITREKADIITDFSKEPVIKGNKVYLNSIFLNLITNSIKYHQPGVPPVIEISTQRLNQKIVIKFTDNGLGIDLNRNSDKVFGLYKRFHSEIEGKGIGLFMVKTQVDILGGNIKIASKVNKGTVFTIELNQ